MLNPVVDYDDECEKMNSRMRGMGVVCDAKR